MKIKLRRALPICVYSVFLASRRNIPFSLCPTECPILMQWRILAIGKPKLSFARDGIAEYLGRLQAFAPAAIEYLKAGTAERESAALLARSEGLYRVVLDERGEQVPSRALAQRLGAWEQSRAKGIAVIVGGAAGHAGALRERADWLWSLSALTLQHELALVMALEQLYRAYTIKAGLPYHRE
jgi:23S rRNA (pseudouridine1915-N3)-methyltransferase